MIIRNKLSGTLAGGPRQYTQIRNKIIVSTKDVANNAEVLSEIRDVGFAVSETAESGVAVLKAEEDIATVVSNAADRIDVPELPNSMPKEFNQNGAVKYATDRIVEATSNLLLFVKNIPGVRRAFFAETLVDYGPENLRISPVSREDVFGEDDDLSTMKELNDRLGITELHKTYRGEGTTVAIFDTGFAEGLIDESRIVNTYHDDSVDSVYASKEGHGTMTAGGACASSDVEGVPYDAPAPESDVILVRITNEAGQIDSSVITEAWSWLANLDIEGPVIANHSYGTPLCSGRPRTQFCDGPEQKLVSRILTDSSITAVYAAGNEAMRCGHRPSGLTNGITGTNSLPSVITVGALLTSGKEAQRYSSHGRGDCSPVSDPKPNVSAPIPESVYYGVEDGFKLKDMSTGLIGSSGGTSHAAPYTAGVIALLQSVAINGDSSNEDDMIPSGRIKQMLQDTAETPHTNAANITGLLISEKGYGARFGYGEIRPEEMVGKVLER